MKDNDKLILYIGWIATVMAVLMYVAYIPQIITNLSGSGVKGNPIQPLVACINGTLWVIYGIKKEPRDLAVAIANAPGIFFGFAAFITAL
ncbi:MULTISPECIES: SemiSWEET family transporter [Leuconostoc]|uniref:SemiSWEET family transporter n=1 Tax=Leuconostoc TaxID=1243 RepID=UPI0032E054A7